MHPAARTNATGTTEAALNAEERAAALRGERGELFVINVLRPFRLSLQPRPNEHVGREIAFGVGRHEIPAEIARHPYIALDHADGCVESPQKAQAREAAEEAQRARLAVEEAAARAHLEAQEQARQADLSRVAELERAALDSDDSAAEIAATLHGGKAAGVGDDDDDPSPLGDPLIPAGFDFRKPDYSLALAEWRARIGKLRDSPAVLDTLRAYYAEHPAAFISQWAFTFDPRNAEKGLPTTLPFLLFPRQVQLVNWIMRRWKAGEPGIVEKSRDVGLSFLTVAFACAICLFRPGIVIGFGSRKAEYVDSLGAPRALFEKARLILSCLPGELSGNWDRDKHSSLMKIVFPATGSVLVGESGDGIGRGDRTSLYFVDEAAFLERPELVEASLSATTNVRIDVSTPHGLSNVFAQKRHSGRIKVFTFHWRSDPRKNQEWYERQVAQLDPATVAREIDISYLESVEHCVIPHAWIQSAIGAHAKLGIEVTGRKYAALDVADQGVDLNCLAARHGILVDRLQTWSGKGSDTFQTTERALGLCSAAEIDTLIFDSDGLGAGVRGDVTRLNVDRAHCGLPAIRAIPFRGSGGVSDPDGSLVPSRLNKDHFLNAKSEAWWNLRLRFQQTHRAVTVGMDVDPDSLISIDPNLSELSQLIVELSQPTFSLNATGKILIDKMPSGTRSPNRADAFCYLFAPGAFTLEIWAKLGAGR